MSGERITGLRTSVLRLPLRGTLSWGASSEMGELAHVLLQLETESGLTSLVEAPVRPTIYGETIASIERVLEEHLAPMIVGRCLFDDSALAAALKSVPFNFAARGALDAAVQLARADATGQELPEAWDATRQRVQVSFILGIAPLEEMVREARQVVRLGVNVLKVKVGRDPAHDRQVLTELGEALAGLGVTLYVDANQAWTAAEASQRLDELAGLGVSWVEEPLPVHLTRSRAQLRRESPLPLIADDSCFTAADLERELDFDTFDILNVKPARSGLGGSLALIERAAAAGKGVMLGSQATSSLGTAHTAALAFRPEVDHPSELAFPLKLQEDLLPSPMRFEGGFLARAELNRALRGLPRRLSDAAPHGVRIGREPQEDPR